MSCRANDGEHVRLRAKNRIRFRVFLLAAMSKPSSSFSIDHPNDGKSQYGGRDVVGYGEKPVCPQWPNGAKVRLSFGACTSRKRWFLFVELSLILALPFVCVVIFVNDFSHASI